MQLATSGARAIARSSGATGRLGVGGGRSIHIPTGGVPKPSTTNRLLQQTRTLFTRFIGHLTTPGTLGAPGLSGSALSRSSFAAQQANIHSRLSVSARQALALGKPAFHLPRAPIVPRGMTQVGLGTARNFSSGRPIFANLIENVPVLGRAAYEADWDVKSRVRARAHLNGKRKASGKSSKSGQRMKENAKSLSASKIDKELDRYFAPAALPAPTTSVALLIPLAPTPTGRLPLPLVPAMAPHRLISPALVELHTSHSLHAVRVSSLFARLDGARVWDRGARCEAYGDAGGLCTVLRLTFDGWTRADVEAILGDIGRGWCQWDEPTNNNGCSLSAHEDEDDDALSQVLSRTHSFRGDRDVLIDPAHSVVLPTLDFSSDFLAATSIYHSGSSGSFEDAFPTVRSPAPSQAPWDDDDSDCSEYSWSSSMDAYNDAAHTASSWGTQLRFSSHAEDEMDWQSRPREVMF